MLELLLAASATAVATGIGAVPVFILGPRAKAIEPALLGVAAGVMAVAAISGLALPAWDQGEPAEVFVGLVFGVGFLLGARRLIGSGSRREARTAGSASALVFLVLFVHSLPEGFAIGTAYASETAGLGLFVVIAIAIQNIPEGTSVAIPMAAAGYTPRYQFWAAVATSLPQPVGALIAYLIVAEVTALLPLSFAFAAGAMVALVIVELAPTALAAARLLAICGGVAGAALMLGLTWTLRI
jgi:ZIP family zinc transporter